MRTRVVAQSNNRQIRRSCPIRYVGGVFPGGALRIVWFHEMLLNGVANDSRSDCRIRLINSEPLPERCVGHDVTADKPKTGVLVARSYLVFAFHFSKLARREQNCGC